MADESQGHEWTPRHVRLGFATYADYLQSDHWRGFRGTYFASDRPKKCQVCGDSHVDLHHITYFRLGAEKLDDVTPLCRGHHERVHAILKERRWPTERTSKAIKLIVEQAELMCGGKASFKTMRQRFRELVVECAKYKAKLSPSNPLRRGNDPWRSGWPLERKIESAETYLAELRKSANEEWATRRPKREEKVKVVEVQKPLKRKSSKAAKKTVTMSKTEAIQTIVGAARSATEPGKIVMNNDILELAKSSSGGWSEKQLRLIGVEWPMRSGWKETVIGKLITSSVVHLFVSLRDRHLPKGKKKSPIRVVQQTIVEMPRREKLEPKHPGPTAEEISNGVHPWDAKFNPPDKRKSKPIKVPNFLRPKSPAEIDAETRAAVAKTLIEKITDLRKKLPEHHPLKGLVLWSKKHNVHTKIKHMKELISLIEDALSGRKSAAQGSPATSTPPRKKTAKFRSRHSTCPKSSPEESVWDHPMWKDDS